MPSFDIPRKPYKKPTIISSVVGSIPEDLSPDRERGAIVDLCQAVLKLSTSLGKEREVVAGNVILESTRLPAENDRYDLVINARTGLGSDGQIPWPSLGISIQTDKMDLRSLRMLSSFDSQGSLKFSNLSAEVSPALYPVRPFFSDEVSSFRQGVLAMTGEDFIELRPGCTSMRKIHVESLDPAVPKWALDSSLSADRDGSGILNGWLVIGSSKPMQGVMLKFPEAGPMFKAVICGPDKCSHEVEVPLVVNPDAPFFQRATFSVPVLAGADNLRYLRIVDSGLGS